jgi:hypothetical protein
MSLWTEARLKAAAAERKRKRARRYKFKAGPVFIAGVHIKMDNLFSLYLSLRQIERFRWQLARERERAGRFFFS